MYQIWTRIIVTSLILLGNTAFASEICHRSDAETLISGSSVQVFQSETQDDSDSTWQLALAGVNSIQSKVNLRYQTLLPRAHSIAYASNYYRYFSRAPPTSL